MDANKHSYYYLHVLKVPVVCNYMARFSKARANCLYRIYLTDQTYILRRLTLLPERLTNYLNHGTFSADGYQTCYSFCVSEHNHQPILLLFPAPLLFAHLNEI